MARLQAALLAFSLLSAPHVALAQSTSGRTAAAEQDAERAAKALSLAQLIESRDLLLDAELLEAQFVSGMLATPDGKSMEDEFPGIVQAIWRSAAAELRSQTEASLPSYWERLAAIYSANLSVEEIDAASKFFGSDVGRKVIKLKGQTMIRQLVTLAAQSETGAITGEAFSTSNREASESVVTALSQNEQLTLAAFGLSAAGVKLQSLGPHIQKVAVEWMNESTPEEDAKIEALMLAAIEAHIEASQSGEAPRAEPK